MSIHLPQTAFATPMELGECPLWHAVEDSLYWIDITGQAIHRLHPATQAHRIWHLSSEPGCIALCASGGLLIAMRSGLAWLDPVTDAVVPVADAPYDTRSTRFNDGRCDASGRLWVGTVCEPHDPLTSALFCVERGIFRDTGKRASVSNGVAFSPDNRTLYHADTTAHRITTYDFDVDSGAIENGRLFKQFSTDRTHHNYGGRPDGAAVDSEGAYWCAMYEGSCILRFSPEGELLTRIELPVRCPTMMAFGGADLCTLYITSVRRGRPAKELVDYPLSGCLFALKTEVSGRLEIPYIR